MDMADLIRVKTASTHMGVTTQYIYTLIKNDRLKAMDIDEVTFVSRKAVEDLQRERIEDQKKSKKR